MTVDVMDTKIQHGSYQCPGLTVGGGKQDINRKTMRELLAEEDMLIPLFQRKYCWQESLAKGWFRDTLSSNPAYTVTGTHSAGKVIVKRTETNTLVVLDGQQRVTTTLIFLMALRDCLFTLQPKKNADLDKFDNIVTQLQNVLVKDQGGFMNWLQTAAGDDSDFVEGERQNFSRLTPSYSDRAAYYRILVGGFIKGCKFDPRVISHRMNMKGEGRSLQEIVWHSFMKSIQAHLEHTGARVHNDLERIAYIMKRALDNMSVMRVNILNDINYAQVFEWYQEKSIFGMGRLLSNPHPGLDFHITDLVRNLLMAPFMNSTLEIQEKKHEQLWIPLEDIFASPSEMDNMIIAFNFEQASREDRFIGEYENTITGHAKAAVGMGFDMSSLFEYARFVSYFEGIQEHGKSEEESVVEAVTTLSIYAKSFMFKSKRSLADFPAITQVNTRMDLIGE